MSQTLALAIENIEEDERHGNGISGIMPGFLSFPHPQKKAIACQEFDKPPSCANGTLSLANEPEVEPGEDAGLLFPCPLRTATNTNCLTNGEGDVLRKNVKIQHVCTRL